MRIPRLFIRLKNSYLKREIIFAADTLISLMVSLLVIFLIPRLLGSSPLAERAIAVYMTAAVFSSVVFFLLLRTSRIIIRHLTAKDLVPFVGAALCKGLTILLSIIAMQLYTSRAIIFVSIDVLLTLFLVIGVRLLMIFVYDRINQRQLEEYHQKRILVYGTSDKSVAAVKRLLNSVHYKCVGFLQRGREPKYTLATLPVLSFDDRTRFDNIVRLNNIDAILFSRDTDAQAEENLLVKYCSEHGLKTLIVPSLDEVQDGEPLLHPREIKVEDLLGRQEIVISLDRIKADFAGKVVMVTGAAGSIGSELVRQLAGFGVKQIVLYDNAETPMHNIRLELEDKFKDLNFVPVIGSVRHPERLDYAFRNWHPQIVFHAAAYKHVPLMEENPCEAVLANVYGSRNVADKCLEYGVEKMVMISTDKAVNPTNIMGCTKRLAEIYVQSLGLAVEKGQVSGKTRFVTTRFGNVLGSNGSVIPRFREQIAHGGPVTVTHPDINRFFMTIPEACRLVMEAAVMSTGNQIFVFDMGKPVKIDDLARRMITLAGFTPDKDIKIEYTGLRPGEKLYEEVLANDENTLPAFHERIRIAKVREYPYADAVAYADKLENLARAVEIPDMVRLMKKIVPEYKSENSKFAALDQEDK